MKAIFILKFVGFLFFIESFGQNTRCCKESVFLEENGIVIFEAENTCLSTGWILEDEIEGYSGAGYITWTEPTTTEPNGQGLLSYKFKILKEGKYTLKIRNYHSCEDVTECNDIFVKMDHGEWRKNFNHSLSKWDWNTQQDINHDFSDAEYNLLKGEHTLYLSGRSQNFSIDKISLYHSNTAKNLYKNAKTSECIACK